MQLGFGDDFRAARRGWLYHVRDGQPWWAAVLLAFAGFAVLSILQMAMGLVAYVVLQAVGEPSVVAALDPGSAEFQAAFIKAAVLGIAPAAAISSLVVWWFAGLGDPDKRLRLPLHLPAMGVLGWFALLAGFAIAIYVLFFGTFYILGIDPETYQPTADGIKDTVSKSGMIEKTMADLAKQPMLFAAAYPGIAIFTPIVEELIFRGALFNAIANSWFGKAGAVVITAAVWAVIHATTAPWLFVFIIFMMGLLLGVLLLRFGSLWVTIACHALWNSLTVISIFNLPGVQ
jgi:uncharacterized protein